MDSDELFLVYKLYVSVHKALMRSAAMDSPQLRGSNDY
jgi:hypothetical protein